jgi:DNA-binding transcriptional MerR regulator
LQHFGTAEVSRLADIPVRSVRAMVRAGYVTPARGPRGVLRFSFQDLVVLRTARDLLAASVPPRRVGTALRAMRRQLPPDLPARGLSVTAAGERIVVNEGGNKRDVLSGQLLLALEVRLEDGAIQLIDQTSARAKARASPAEECLRQFEAALALEEVDPDAAVEAYRACVMRHAHAGARANLGRLLHLQGQISEAVQVYLGAPQDDAGVLYNLGVALEDLGRAPEAIAAYRRVIDLDKDHEDAHHNIARLYQESGDRQRALRHWNAYRRLSRAQRP